MIDFELTEDHKALIQTVREFAQKEVAPYIKEWDEQQHFERGIFSLRGGSVSRFAVDAHQSAHESHSRPPARYSDRHGRANFRYPVGGTSR